MRFLVATLLSLAPAHGADAAHYFATITEVDAKKGTVSYNVTTGKDRGTTVVGASVAKDCVIKEGVYRQGKPARTFENDDIADGLKNDVFNNASAEKPLRVDIYTADEDDAEKGIKKGDIVKILVNPPPKKK